MRNKPGNLVLLILAILLLADIFVVRPHDEGDFLIAIGVFGALVSRAFLEDPQSVVVCLLGAALAAYSIFRNGGAIDRNSDSLFVLSLLIAFAYAIWEKILKWISI
jgi:hypothetical protein